MKHTIVVNDGSTSRKYALYSEEEGKMDSHYENTPDGFIVTERFSEKEEVRNIDEEIYNDAFPDFIKSLYDNKFIESDDDVDTVAIRIVAPGKFFQEHKIIDKKYLENLDEVHDLSPLHIGPAQDEVSDIMDRLPDVKIIGISDSAFHKTKNDLANFYAIPKKMTEELEIYRYGYHGISINYVVEKLNSDGNLGDKTIVCHLGGGSSLTAVKDGESFDTSMGYSPLEGVAMASRSGNIDPNALIRIMNEEDLTNNELQDFLYHKCGVSGLSEISSDTRILLREANWKNSDADFTLDYYAYQIKKYIGAYQATMGGLDTLVFTGTIGLRAAEIRRRICEGLEYLGVKLNQNKNKMTIKTDGEVSAEDSEIKILVVETDEALQMVRLAKDL